MSRTTKSLLGLFFVFAIVVAILYFLGYIKPLENIVKNNSNKTPELIEKDRVVIGISYASGIYPEQMAIEAAEMARNANVYEALVSFNKDRKLFPDSGLALSWSNPDDNTWRFEINPKAKFSDGTFVKASDVKFTYEYIVSKQFSATAMMPSVKEINIIDDNTVDFVTPKPDPILANKLSYMFILSEKDVKAHGSTQPIGSGPYILTKSTADEIVYDRNENYWRSEKPKVKQLVYKIMVPTAGKDPSVNKIEAMQAGTIDVASLNDTPELEAMVNNSSTKIQSQIKQMNSINFLLFNILKDGPLANRYVRKAIYESINVDDLITAITSGGNISSQVISNNIFGYNSDIKRLPTNTAQAKEDLISAGYPTGFSIKIAAIKGDPISAEIAKQLAVVGIIATPEYFSPNDLYANLASGNYETAILGYSADTGDASELFDFVFHTQNQQYGAGNKGYSNKEVDSLIEKAGSTLDAKNRLAYLKQIMVKLSDDVAYVPLFSGKTLYIYSPGIYLDIKNGGDGTIRCWDIAGIKE